MYGEKRLPCISCYAQASHFLSNSFQRPCKNVMFAMDHHACLSCLLQITVHVSPVCYRSLCESFLSANYRRACSFVWKFSSCKITCLRLPSKLFCGAMTLRTCVFQWLCIWMAACMTCCIARVLLRATQKIFFEFSCVALSWLSRSQCGSDSIQDRSNDAGQQF